MMLNAIEIEVCAKMGVDPQDFAALTPRGIATNAEQGAGDHSSLGEVCARMGLSVAEVLAVPSGATPGLGQAQNALGHDDDVVRAVCAHTGVSMADYLATNQAVTSPDAAGMSLAGASPPAAAAPALNSLQPAEGSRLWRATNAENRPLSDREAASMEGAR